MNKKKIFIIIGIFWLVILSGFVAYKEYTLKTGTEILIKTVPIDPRDLFRGDYVVLKYDISTRLGKDGLYGVGKSIYLPFKIDSNNIASFGKLNVFKPKEGLYIKGEVTRIVDYSIMDISYGIESYFVPEGRGKEIERNLGNIYAKVVIDRHGNSVLKGLVLDGKDIK